MSTNDGGPACRWCLSPAVRKQGRIWLCARHYRHQQMRVNAKRHDKTVPSYAELDAITPSPLVCPHCLCDMNWLAVDGQSTVATLQHNRDGTHQLLCRACNTRHARHDGDSFYSIGLGYKLCQDCKQVKMHSEFWRNGKRLKSWCKDCCNKRHQEWAAQNREHYNAKQRERRRTRAVAS